MDLGSSVHGVSQARMLEWVAISFSRGSSQSRDGTCVSCIYCTGRQILYHWATRSCDVFSNARKVNYGHGPRCQVQFQVIYWINWFLFFQKKSNMQSRALMKLVVYSPIMFPTHDFSRWCTIAQLRHTINKFFSYWIFGTFVIKQFTLYVCIYLWTIYSVYTVFGKFFLLTYYCYILMLIGILHSTF